MREKRKKPQYKTTANQTSELNLRIRVKHIRSTIQGNFLYLWFKEISNTTKQSRRCSLLLLFRLGENANQKPNCNNGVPSLRVVFSNYRRTSVLPSVISSPPIFATVRISFKQTLKSASKCIYKEKQIKEKSINIAIPQHKTQINWQKSKIISHKICKPPLNLMNTNETEPIGQIRERNWLRNQIQSEFLPVEIPECIRERTNWTKIEQLRLFN